ncbi:S41 family peptidase, partial [Maribacter sp.]|nr:S41 family peptidase [Maribacter sp.]
MKKVLLFLFCSIAGSFLNAQSNEQLGSLIPMAQLHEDLNVLKSQLETVHAGLYTYTSKEELDAAFIKIKEQVNRPMSDIEFYRFVAPLQQKVKNGHSMIIPSERWDQVKEKELPLFPFDVYWVDDKVYVLRNLSDDNSIEAGSLIKTINGELATDVFNDLLDNWTSDGHNRTFPASHISSDFPNYYANIKGIPTDFEIDIVAPNTAERSLTVKARLNEKLNEIALSRYNHKRSPWYIDEDDQALSLKISDETAVLKVPTFGTSSRGVNGKKYHKFYAEAFRKIRMAEVKHLILDLRDNGGGDPKPQLALLSNLIDEPIVLYKRVYGVTNK